MPEAAVEVAELEIDTGQLEASLKRAEGAFSHLGDRGERALAKLRGEAERASKIYGDMPSAISRTERALDTIRGRYDAVAAAEARYARQLQADLATINRAVALNVISEQQAAREIDALRQHQIQRLDELRTAQNSIGSATAANDNQAAYRRRNSFYQVADITQGAALGMPLGMIGMQQIPQLAQNYVGEGGGLKAVKEDLAAIKNGAISAATSFAAMLGPVGLVAAGFAAVAAAAGAFFLASREGAKSLDDALTAHEVKLRRLGDAYGFLGDQIKNALPEGRGTLSLAEAASRGDLRLSMVNAARDQIDLMGSVGLGASKGGQAGGFQVKGEFAEYADAIAYLRKTALDSAPDIEGFRRMVTTRWEMDPLNQELTKSGGKLLEFTDQLMQAVQQLNAFNDARLRSDMARRDHLMDERGPLSTKADDDRRRRERFEAGIRQAEAAVAAARTDDERIAAAGRLAGAQNPVLGRERNNEMFAARLKEQQALEQQSLDAALGRTLAMDQQIRSAEQSLSLIGKTAAEQAGLNALYTQENAIRDEAAQRGIAVNEREIAALREKAAEITRIVQLQEQTRLRTDLLDDARMMNMSPQDQGIYQRLDDGQNHAVDARRLSYRRAREGCAMIATLKRWFWPDANPVLEVSVTRHDVEPARLDADRAAQGEQAKAELLKSMMSVQRKSWEVRQMLASGVLDIVGGGDR